MAIEGPLRELGIHDVFQLLDLSRKTGTLTVTSELRDNEGTVWFDGGKVIYATIKSNPHPLGLMLVKSGKVTEADLDRALLIQKTRNDGRRFGEILVELNVLSPRELERQDKLQVEEVVFELMSWREGFFSFEERVVSDVPLDARIRISTESLLMEGARRIDEWSRIADKVPSLSVIPTLAPVEDDRASVLDLLPHEWEVLMMIDGDRDLRGIAGGLGRSEFEVAKIAYGLVSTGVVELRTPARASVATMAAMAGPEEALAHARECLHAGKNDEALASARAAQQGDPSSTEARLIAARALVRLARYQDAVEELRRAVQADPITAAVHLDLGFAATRVGDFGNARASWEHFLRLAPSAVEGKRVRTALETLTRLVHLLEAHSDD